jgi:uncharacterized protein
MLWGAATGALELRATEGGFRISGAFPYAVETELAPGRAERIEARAFAERIEAGADVHFLSGHDYAKPLASRHAGTLEIRDTDTALEFEAEIADGTTWARDFLAAHKAGLIRGVSPGFRVPAGGERIERRGAGLLRSVTKAELFEISAVTRPAYPAAQIEARAWAAETVQRRTDHPLKRWRL